MRKTMVPDVSDPGGKMSKSMLDSFQTPQYQQIDKADMMFCPVSKCPHYNETTKYPRKCYYEPQCWKGYLDVLLITTKSLIQRKILNPFATLMMRIKSNTKK